MQIRTYSLYVLSDPERKAVRYVGISHEPKRRFRRHCLSGQKTILSSHKQKWIAKLWRAGLKPLLAIVDEGLNLEAAKAREMDLIAVIPNLTNGTKGGDTNAWDTFSLEARERCTRALRTKGNRALATIRAENPERWTEIKRAMAEGVRNSAASKRASLENIKKAQAAAQASEKMRAAARKNIKLAHLANRQSTEIQLTSRRANMRKALELRLSRPMSERAHAAHIENAKKARETQARKIRSLRERGEKITHRVSEEGREAMRANMRKASAAARISPNRNSAKQIAASLENVKKAQVAAREANRNPSPKQLEALAQARLICQEKRKLRREQMGAAQLSLGL